MAPEIFRVVIVDTVESEQAVQACLQSFGHISRIVFWKKDQDKVNRYFVEFIVPESVGRACKFYLRDFRVHALASSKQLVDVFASLTGSGSSRNGHSTAPARTSTLPIPRRDSISSAKDIDRTHKSKPSSSSTSNGARNPPLLPAAAIQSPLLPSKPAFSPSSSNHTSSTNHPIDQNANKASDRPVHAPSALTVTANMSGLSISNGQTHKSRVPSDRVGDDVPAYLSVSPGGPIRPNAIIPDGLPPLRTTISLSLYGERIHYDLSTLEDDPSTIIRLLKMTGSDRDHWMIVASWYRRAGKLHAAVLVVSKMLEVMKANGLKEADLRPAFLMLASCHTELRRRVIAFHGKETDESRSEHDRARRCLQKVHGINDTDPDTPGHGPQTMANSSPTLTRSQASTTITRPTSAGRLASSSRELQLLRERHTSHLSQLAEVIAGKRKAEDTITQERVIRRRLEREKAELEHQLTLAQEREQRAQELVHLEKMGRIDAEQRASEEEQKRIDAEKGAGPLLEALSTVFSRAATGADVSALAAGIMQVTSA